MRLSTYGILGLGKLGSRMARRLIDTGVDSRNILVVGRPSSLELIREFGLRPVASESLGQADVLLVAVKPFQAEEAIASIGEIHGKVVISFMANVSLAQLREQISTARLVRAMTTTACEAGYGVGLYTTTPDFSENDHLLVRSLLERLGRHDFVHDERHVQVYATVLSSLTGMVYQLLGDFERGMTHVGAPRQYCELMLEAVAASVAYARSCKGTHFLALSDDVTSPAGTTDAARLVLEEHRVTYAIIRAIEAAAHKAGGHVSI